MSRYKEGGGKRGERMMGEVGVEERWRRRRGGRGEIRAWNSKNAMIVGGCAATSFEKSNERRSGGACMKAGKSARIVKTCSCETQSSFVGCM